MGLGTTPSLRIFSKVKASVIISGMTGLVGGEDGPAHHPGKEAVSRSRVKGLLCVTRTILAAGCGAEELDPFKAFYLPDSFSGHYAKYCLADLSHIPTWA